MKNPRQVGRPIEREELAPFFSGVRCFESRRRGQDSFRSTPRKNPSS